MVSAHKNYITVISISIHILKEYTKRLLVVTNLYQQQQVPGYNSFYFKHTEVSNLSTYCMVCTLQNILTIMNDPLCTNLETVLVDQLTKTAIHLPLSMFSSFISLLTSDLQICFSICQRNKKVL